MRVCDITNFYHLKSGGVKTYLHQKMIYFSNHSRHEHLVVVPGSHNGEKKYCNSTIRTIKAPEVPFARPYRIITDHDLVEKIIHQFRPDIIEAGCPFSIPRAAAYKRKYGCVLSGFYHSDFPKAFIQPNGGVIEKVRSLALEKAGYGFVKKLYRQTDINFAPSVTAASSLLYHGISNVSVLPLGVDLEQFHPRYRSTQLRKLCGIPGESLLLLYAGRFGKEKGLVTLQQAFEILSARQPGRFHLLLVGDGPLGPPLRKWATRRKDITVLGYMPHSQLAAVYASADLFVTACAVETFGLTILEAQASGLPVAAVASGAVTESVCPGASVLAEPGIPEALAELISQIAEKELRGLGIRARKFMEVNYAWAITFNKLFAHYETLTGCRRPNRQTMSPSGVTSQTIAGA